MATDLMQPGGGLTNSKLALADATVSDVLSGKKFYSGDKELKTGTMTNRGAWMATVGSGNSVTIPQGYHNGNGKVNSIPLKEWYTTLTAGNSGYPNPATANAPGKIVGIKTCSTDVHDGKGVNGFIAKPRLSFNGNQLRLTGTFDYTNQWVKATVTVLYE